MNDTENEEEVKKEVKLDVFGHTVNKTHNLGQHDNILIICWFLIILKLSEIWTILFKSELEYLKKLAIEMLAFIGIIANLNFQNLLTVTSICILKIINWEKISRGLKYMNFKKYLGQYFSVIIKTFSWKHTLSFEIRSSNLILLTRQELISKFFVSRSHWIVLRPIILKKH